MLQQAEKRKKMAKFKKRLDVPKPNNFKGNKKLKELQITPQTNGTLNAEIK